MVPSARRAGRGRTRGLAPHGRPGAHPRRRGETRPRRRYPAERDGPHPADAGSAPGRTGGAAASADAPGTPERASANRAGFRPRKPTHRCGKGRSAKRTRPKPIWRLASGADASETALSARSERLGRNHAHVWEGTQETPCRISTSDCAEIAVPPLAYKGFAIFMSEKMGNLQQSQSWRTHSVGH